MKEKNKEMVYYKDLEKGMVISHPYVEDGSKWYQGQWLVMAVTPKTEKNRVLTLRPLIKGQLDKIRFNILHFDSWEGKPENLTLFGKMEEIKYWRWKKERKKESGEK